MAKRVFISWSGAESCALATELREWLPYVVPGVDPWMSSRDLASGVRWQKEIGQELERSDYGILCVTPAALKADWLLFEAGALSKFVDTSRVCPLLFGLRPADVDGPLSQFQCIVGDREGFRKLVVDLARELGVGMPTMDMQITAFDRWWSKLDESIQRIKTGSASRHVAAPRSSDEMLAEVVDLVRNLTQRHGAGFARGKSAVAQISLMLPTDESLRGHVTRCFVPETYTFAQFVEYLWNNYLYGRVPEASYQTSWILVNSEAGGTQHYRMPDDPLETLASLCIAPYSELEIVFLGPKLPRVQTDG